jgi:pantoate--beta-alanine ligase
MIIVKTVNELKDEIAKLSGDIGFVPTMGALHKGHLSLMDRAKLENRYLVSSIFVNPTQFLAGEDFEKYPNRYEDDIKLSKDIGVDILFMPNIDDIYGFDEVTIKAPKVRSFTLEGYKRAGHFDGVLQIVLKLFNLVKPTRAYFGKKDAQQLSMISIMVKNLFLDIEIIACDIIRDDDGLALSSRNIYLSSSQREQALAIPNSIFKAKEIILNGELKSKVVIDSMKSILSNLDIEYIEIVDRDFNQIDTIEIDNSIVLVVVKVGDTRLLDNLFI